MLAGGRGSGLKQLCPLISLCRQSLRLMQTEAEFLPAPYGVGSRRRSMLMPRGSRPTGGMKGRFMRHCDIPADETDPPFGAPAGYFPAGHRGAVGMPICCSKCFAK